LALACNDAGHTIMVERRGAPMLRRRHLHVGIAGAEIDGWLLCFMRAWDETVGDRPDLAGMVLPQVHNLALHMRNREDATAT
jgi:hemoglobin